LQQIGSGTINLSGDGPDEYFSKLFSGGSRYGLYIGGTIIKIKKIKINLTPIQWLGYLAEGLEEFIPEQIKAFDEICGELGEVLTTAEILTAENSDF